MVDAELASVWLHANISREECGHLQLLLVIAADIFVQVL